MIRKIAVLAFGASCLLLADDEPGQRVQLIQTEQIDFAPGGTIHLENSTGELQIEGWDQPRVEITVVKSTKHEIDERNRAAAVKRLDGVQVVALRRGNDLTIATEFPEHKMFERPFRGESDFEIEVHIKASETAPLAIDHRGGDINIDNMRSDIRASDSTGSILLHLPDRAYVIDARSKLGSVISDFPGHDQRKRWLGQQFEGGAAGAPKLYLRVGFGDIVILKMQTPELPRLQ